MTLNPAFQHSYYLFRRKVLKLFGGAFHVYDADGNLVFYSEQKAFRLREDVRLYADPQRAQELLRIKTPQILDFAATYYVEDATTGEQVGAVRRKGLRSLVRDRWLLLSADGHDAGRLEESSLAGALLSRLVELVPQHYAITTLDGSQVAEVQQHFNPFVLKYGMTIPEPEPAIDRRLLIVTGILLAAIERRQE
jgi:uncharacterized protein YxjI